MHNYVKLLFSHIILTFGGTFILMLLFPGGATSMPGPLYTFCFYNFIAMVIHALVVALMGIWRPGS
jgi:hypothetical protein